MSDVVEQVSVPAGLDALGKIVIQFVAAVKGGTNALTAAEAAVAPLVGAAGVIGEVGADFSDAQVYVWAGLFVGELAQVLAGKAAAAPAAAPVA
jgi:hypothetical protein